MGGPKIPRLSFQNIKDAENQAAINEEAILDKSGCKMRVFRWLWTHKRWILLYLLFHQKNIKLSLLNDREVGRSLLPKTNLLLCLDSV